MKAVAALFLALITSAFVCAKPTTVPTPAALLGIWDVVGVRVDNEDQPRWRYFPDDLRFVGTELIVEPDRVTWDMYTVCSNVSWRINRSKWGSYLRGPSMRRPPSGSHPNGSYPTPSSFGINATANTSFNGYTLHCGGIDGKNNPLDHDGYILSADKQTLYRPNNEMFMVLQRRTVGTKPEPGFRCEGALSAAQRAICASVPMAALDRSVMTLWTRYFDGAFCKGSDRGRCLEEQRTWLLERDSCGADLRCIAEKTRGIIETNMSLGSSR